MNLTKKEKKIIKRNIIYPKIGAISFALAFINILIFLIVLVIGFLLYEDFISTNSKALLTLISVPSIVLIFIFGYTTLYCYFTNSPWVKTGNKMKTIMEKYEKYINNNPDNEITATEDVNLLKMLKETAGQYKKNALEISKHNNITYNNNILPALIVIGYILTIIACTFSIYTQAHDAYNTSVEKILNQRTIMKQNFETVFGYSIGEFEEDKITTRIYDGASSKFSINDKVFVLYDINRKGMIESFRFDYEINNIETDLDYVNETFNKFYTVFKMNPNGLDNANFLKFDPTITNELIQAIKSSTNSKERIIRFEYKNNNVKMSQTYFIEDQEIIIFFD